MISGTPISKIKYGASIEIMKIPRTSNLHWVTKENIEYPITQLTDDHLVNCIRFLEKGISRTILSTWEVYSNLIKEAETRGLEYDNTPDWDK
jgi:hypothetical protein